MTTPACRIGSWPVAGTPLPAQTHSLEDMTQTWKQAWQLKSTLKDGSGKLPPKSHLRASAPGLLVLSKNGQPALPGRTGTGPPHSPRTWKLWRQSGKKPGDSHASTSLRKAQVPSGWKSGPHQAPQRPEEAEWPCPGVSQEAGQAGVGSILSLELHRRRAVCPLLGKRTHK